ncbi:unnamed protein product, partial [Ectocarpus sp. 12 AP-2014]
NSIWKEGTGAQLQHNQKTGDVLTFNNPKKKFFAGQGNSLLAPPPLLLLLLLLLLPRAAPTPTANTPRSPRRSSPFHLLFHRIYHLFFSPSLSVFLSVKSGKKKAFVSAVWTSGRVSASTGAAAALREDASSPPRSASLGKDSVAWTRPGAASKTMSFGMEQVRERLRQATAVCASVETGYWQHRSSINDKSAATFSQYRKRLVEEKHALTGEVLSYLGLHWVAPSHGASPSNNSSRSAASTAGEPPAAGKLLLPRPPFPRPAAVDNRFQQARVPPPVATSGRSSRLVDEEQKERSREAGSAQREPSFRGVWVEEDNFSRRMRPPNKNDKDAQEQVFISAAEGGYQAASTPPPTSQQQQQQHKREQQEQQKQPKDHLQHSDVAERYGGSSGATEDLGGRSRLWNTENELPGPTAAVAPAPAGHGSDGVVGDSDALVSPPRQERHPPPTATEQQQQQQ